MSSSSLPRLLSFGNGGAPLSQGSLGLFLGDVVHDKHLVQVGLQHLDKGLVSLVRKVCFEVGLIGEGDKETVGESVIESLGAGVGAPFEIRDLEIFVGSECAKGLHDLLHVLLTGAVFEFEENNVTVGTVFGLGRTGNEGHGEERATESGEGSERHAPSKPRGRGEGKRQASNLAEPSCSRPCVIRRIEAESDRDGFLGKGAFMDMVADIRRAEVRLRLQLMSGEVGRRVGRMARDGHEAFAKISEEIFTVEVIQDLPRSRRSKEFLEVMAEVFPGIGSAFEGLDLIALARGSTRDARGVLGNELAHRAPQGFNGLLSLKDFTVVHASHADHPS